MSTSSLEERFAPQAQAVGSAITRNAAPSSEYIIKLAEAQNVLAQAAAHVRSMRAVGMAAGRLVG